jgi:DNA-binding CsgD family transcriptional regulator
LRTGYGRPGRLALLRWFAPSGETSHAEEEHLVVALAGQDLKLDLAYDLADDAPTGALHGELLGRLGALVGCDVASCTVVDHRRRRLLSATTDDPGQNLLTATGFRSAARQHPGFAAYRSGRIGRGTSVAISDVVDAGTFRRTPLYADFYRPRGTADQLLCVVGLDSWQGTILAFNRSRRGFARRDRQVVDLMAPQVARALRHGRRRRAEIAATRVSARTEADVGDALGRLASLTRREHEVARWVGQGATDREIAASLGISHRTVQKHLEQVYRKLDLTNRTSLAAATRTPLPVGPATH